MLPLMIISLPLRRHKKNILNQICALWRCIARMFMAVQFSVVSKWIVPILFAALLCGVFTFVCCLYFGQQFGGENDFERTLGLSVELGGMNLASKINLLILPINFAISAGAIAFATGQIYMLFISAGLLFLLKLFRVWGKRSYDFKEKDAFY